MDDTMEDYKKLLKEYDAFILTDWNKSDNVEQAVQIMEVANGVIQVIGIKK